MSSSTMDVTDALDSMIKNPDAKLISTVSVDRLPYSALFLADPFIFYCHSSDTFHLLCEAYVSRADKRIAHFASTDLVTWDWVGDPITGMNVAFPALYDYYGDDRHILIAPQLGSPEADRLVGFHYDLTGKPARRVWSASMGMSINDRIIVRRPDSARYGAFYGGKHGARSALWYAGVAGFPGETSGINVGPRELVRRRTFLDFVLNKLFSTPKVTFRPAGDPVRSNGQHIVLPLQATMSGEYGELIALVQIEWDRLRYRVLKYIRPEVFGPFAKMHHISWTEAHRDVVFCIDVAPQGPTAKWQINCYKVGT